MGLGLYLSRHVVEAHGGTIRIERPDDGGTRVLLTIRRNNVLSPRVGRTSQFCNAIRPPDTSRTATARYAG
jgi:hypothetical protein